jgi:hypothetical protein
MSFADHHKRREEHGSGADTYRKTKSPLFERDGVRHTEHTGHVISAMGVLNTVACLAR